MIGGMDEFDKLVTTARQARLNAHAPTGFKVGAALLCNDCKMDALKRSVELTQKKAEAGKAEKPPRKMASSKGKEPPARKRKSS
jgi:hypothetical protein